MAKALPRMNLTPERKQLAEALSEARLTRGLSQMDVARELEFMNGQFIYNWESGRSVPPLKHVPALAKLYKLSQRYLRNLMFHDRVAELRKEYKVWDL